MTTLLYRGHEYTQQIDVAAEKPSVELTYRRNVYKARKADVAKQNVSRNGVELSYRGIRYTK